jgi:hypothetical protein
METRSFELRYCVEEWLVAARNDDGSFGKDLASPGEPNWTALAALSIANKL